MNYEHHSEKSFFLQTSGGPDCFLVHRNTEHNILILCGPTSNTGLLWESERKRKNREQYPDLYDNGLLITSRLPDVSLANTIAKLKKKKKNMSYLVYSMW